MAPRPPKRARRDEERDPDLYFYDGNIVLHAARKDGPSIYFRVHKSVLGKNSPIFRDMFSIPSPDENTIETYDGIALVHLHDDPEELKDFLQNFYSSSNATSGLIGSLKLATKYEVDHLRSLKIAQLERDWPSNSTPGAWEILSSYKRLKPESIIRLARDYDVPSVLPAAFYQLSTSCAAEMDLTLLRADDIFAVLAGREKIKSYLQERLPDGIPVWSPCNELLPAELDCENCQVDIFWMTFLLKLFKSWDPMRVLNDLVHTIHNNKYITCEGCRHKACVGFAEEYRLLFAKLPAFFGLA